MSLETQIINRRIKRVGPVGKITGLLAASLVATIGLFFGVDPQVILFRAIVASLVIGCVVSFGVSVIQVANTRR